MFHQTEISIIIPAYNAEKYLPRTLEALLAQTFKNWEALVVDNNSQDSTGKIIKEYTKKDNRIKYLFEEQPGPATARNLGLKNAQGKYIMFCDSDDWYEPNMCEIMYNNISQNDVDIICCNTRVLVEKNLKRIDTPLYYQNNFTGICQINNQLILKTNVVLWNKIFKKSIIDKYNINFPNGHKSDDDCFYLKYMSVSSRIMFENKKLYNYIQRSDSIMGMYMQNLQQNLEDVLYVTKDYVDFCNKYNLYDARKIIIFSYLRFPNFKYAEGPLEDHLKHIFYELFGDNKLFYKFAFPEYIVKSKIFSLERKLVYSKENICRRIVIKLFGKKILSISFKV